MPKLVFFAIVWGIFWEGMIFGYSGMYIAPVVLAAVFLFYSPLIIKSLNILIAGALGWILMFFWVFLINSFRAPSGNFILHISFYIILFLFFASIIYVFEKK